MGLGPTSGNKIGQFAATAYVTCTIIGSGIFVSPKGILQHVESVGLSLCIWVMAAAINGITAMAYIELATSIPECGSDFAYISYVGWRPFAFAFVWLANLIEGSCACAILFMTFGKYITQSLDPLDLDMSEDLRFRMEQCLGVAVIMLLSWVNFFSLRRWASKIQIVMMAMKLISLAIIIATGLYYLIFKGRTENFTHGKMFEGSNWGPGAICLAIYSGNWAYGGWDCLNYGTDEIEPDKISKILPRAVLSGLALASGIYVLANFSYFVILSPQQLLDADAVATSFAEKAMGNFYYAMPALVGILMIGTLNSDIFQWSRLTMAGARKRLMPSMFALKNPENESPRAAVIFHMLLAVGFSFFKDVDTLLDYNNVAGMLRNATAIGALLWIRFKHIPVNSRAVKFPIIVHMMAFTICVTLIAVPFYQDVLEAGVSCGALLLCIASYFIFIYPNYRLPLLTKLDDVTTFVCERLFICLLEDSTEPIKDI